jgi:hypothetical protein
MAAMQECPEQFVRPAVQGAGRSRRPAGPSALDRQAFISVCTAIRCRFAGCVLLRLRLRYVSKTRILPTLPLPRRSKIKVLLEFQGLDRFTPRRGDGFLLADLTPTKERVSGC